MKTLSIRELHLRTGAWVKRVAELGSVVVTERGRPVARLEAIAEPGRENRVGPGTIGSGSQEGRYGSQLLGRGNGVP